MAIRRTELLTALQTDLLNQALAYRQQGRPDELRRICRELLRRSPDCADAWYLLGVAGLDEKYFTQARDDLSRAIALDGHNAEYQKAKALVLMGLRQFRRAEEILKAALNRHPRAADLHCNLGRALMLQERFDEALACFAKALAINPSHVVSHFNSAVVFHKRSQLSAAIRGYQQALAIDPQRPAWWFNLGAAQLSLADYEAAAASFRQALTPAPDHPGALRGLAVACSALKQYAEAEKLFRRCLSAYPEDTEATAHLAIVYQHTAQWPALAQILPRLAQQTASALAQNALPVEQPLFNISRASDPALNLAVARAWSGSIAQQARRASPPFTHGPGHRSADGRTTIGYLSADFRNHAVAHQAVALFELHNRHKYRVCAFSVGPHRDNEYRHRIAAACDVFMDLASADAKEAAHKIKESGVDILVDLMGHTHQNRLDICALRPAPLQVSYLGFLASSGADFIDYLIGDRIVTPPEHAKFYSEKIIQLPHCYQIISPTKGSARDWTRRQAHLPEEAFVYCCFNQAYKIDLEIFACWMEILRSVPSAVLWLYRTNDLAAANLMAAAQHHGVDPARLVFAEKVPISDHLNRLRLADLALDTPLYNGGATTANVLAAGVPLIALMGNHFVSRMSASHLKTLGLEQLLAKDMSHYKHLAVSLARSAQGLQSVRQTLRTASGTSPLFDAPRFVRDLEWAYDAVWSRYCQGQPPESLTVTPELRPLSEIKHHPADDLNKKEKCFNVCQEKDKGFKTHPFSQKRILYFCPDVSIHSAGVRRLYRHVAILKNNGFNAAILHQREGFKAPDQPPVPLLGLDRTQPTAKDVVVIPEGHPHIMHGLRENPCRRFVIALNWDYIYNSLPDHVDWRAFNIERVLVVAPFIGHMISWSMRLPVHLIGSSIDAELYRFDPAQKQSSVAYIQRKATCINPLLRILEAHNKAYLGQIHWQALTGLAEIDYAAAIRAASIFLNLSTAEGFPTSCLEAMAAGTVVAGFDGVGGRDNLIHGKNCLLAPNGDYVTLAYTLAPLLDNLLSGRTDHWKELQANGFNTAAPLTAESEARSLVQFWQKALEGQSLSI